MFIYRLTSAQPRPCRPAPAAQRGHIGWTFSGRRLTGEWLISTGGTVPPTARVPTAAAGPSAGDAASMRGAARRRPAAGGSRAIETDWWLENDSRCPNPEKSELRGDRRRPAKPPPRHTHPGRTKPPDEPPTVDGRFERADKKQCVVSPATHGTATERWAAPRRAHEDQKPRAGRGGCENKCSPSWRASLGGRPWWEAVSGNTLEKGVGAVVSWRGSKL